MFLTRSRFASFCRRALKWVSKGVVLGSVGAVGLLRVLHQMLIVSFGKQT